MDLKFSAGAVWSCSYSCRTPAQGPSGSGWTQPRSVGWRHLDQVGPRARSEAGWGLDWEVAVEHKTAHEASCWQCQHLERTRSFEWLTFRMLSRDTSNSTNMLQHNRCPSYVSSKSFFHPSQEIRVVRFLNKTINWQRSSTCLVIMRLRVRCISSLFLYLDGPL